MDYTTCNARAAYYRLEIFPLAFCFCWASSSSWSSWSSCRNVCGTDQRPSLSGGTQEKAFDIHVDVINGTSALHIVRAVARLLFTWQALSPTRTNGSAPPPPSVRRRWPDSKQSIREMHHPSKTLAVWVTSTEPEPEAPLYSNIGEKVTRTRKSQIFKITGIQPLATPGQKFLANASIHVSGTSCSELQLFGIIYLNY